MIDNPIHGPGDKDLKKIMGPDPKESDPKKPDPKPKSSDEAIVNAKGGGGAAAKQTLDDRKKPATQEETSETYDFPKLEKAKPEDPAKADSAVFSNPKWPDVETLFHQEVEVSVHVTLPKGQEHITRVGAELFAKKLDGPESLSKGEGHAQADGIAVIALLVHKPKGHEDGIAELFIEYTHKLAKMLSTEKVPRPVSGTALKSADHILIPGVAFEKGSSFIGPKGTQSLKAVEGRFNEWEQKFPKKAQIAVFGHADKKEKDAKALSERRAQSAFAFITNDTAAWDKLYSLEKWGLNALQTLLKDLGHYHGALDGQDGPKTQAAFKAFQKGAGLPESGKEDSTTRKALYGAYMKGKHDIQINASRFCQVAGNPWMGCAANNRIKESEDAALENRRVAFILINPNKHFPVNFPCQDGSEAACQGQCKKAGKRSTAEIKCLFYDKLVREEKQSIASESVGQSLKKGDSGPIVEELNIRLAGFGGGVPRDIFDEETETKVKMFQDQWMKEKSPSGIFDVQTAQALDIFTSEYPIDIGIFKCKCGECEGFGKMQFKGQYQGVSQKESANKYEYPGIHRSLAWALKALQFHIKTLGLHFNQVTSAYRCWFDNENHDRKSTNHMGKALDFTISDATGEKGGKSECDIVRTLMVDKINGQIRWGSKDRFSMEPSEKNHPNEFIATNWVHFDVREFESKFLDDKFFCKSNETLNGKSMHSLLGE